MHMEYLVKVVIISIIFIVFDMVWIYANKDMYFSNIKNVQKLDVTTNNMMYYPLPYIFVLLGFFIVGMTFVKMQIERNKNMDKNLVAFLAGGFYGMIIHGVSNCTSLAIYNNYSPTVTAVDISRAFIFNGVMAIIYINMK